MAFPVSLEECGRKGVPYLWKGEHSAPVRHQFGLQKVFLVPTAKERSVLRDLGTAGVTAGFVQRKECQRMSRWAGLSLCPNFAHFSLAPARPCSSALPDRHVASICI